MPTAFKYRHPGRKPYPPVFPWTDEQVQILRERWAAGESASVIARQLGGVSRCAVIGKAHRLDLPNRKPVTRIPYPPRLTPLRSKPKKRFVFSEKFKPAQPSAERFALPPTQVDVARVQLLDLEPRHCRWPVGEPTQGFCGCNRAPGSSYCEAHAARAFAADNRFSYAAKTPAFGIRQFVATDEFLRQQEPVA